MTSYKVYKHTNLINNKVYIGITRQEPCRRWQNGAGYANTYMGNAIAKYGWNNFKHEILADDLTETEACAMEQQLIAQYRSNDRNYGYNIAEGGQVVYGSHDRKGALNHKSRPIKCFDSEHNYIKKFESQNIAAIELGIKRKGITKNCLGESKTYKGYIFEYADIDYIKPVKYEIGKHPNHHTHSVALLDVNGNVIKVFNSIKDACVEYPDCNSNGISKCCSGLLKSYLGRRWSYA